MQTILRSPETDDTIFSQIIDILVSISDREEQSKLGSALTELLAAKLPSLSWIQRSAAKKVSIVDALARLRYGDARSVIVPLIDHADELKLRIAAIKFAARVNAADATTTLSKLANDPERNIRNAALGALVIIDPTNNTLVQTLQSVAADRNAQAEAMRNAFSAFSLLETKSRFFVSEQERDKNNQIARLISQLLEACAEHDVLISISLTDDTEKANGENRMHFCKQNEKRH
jgi:hypothetical protein